MTDAPIPLDEARRREAERLDSARPEAKPRLAPVPTEAAPPAFSEDELALRFSARHKDDLRYVAAWSKWLQWDGTRWAFDRTVNVYDLARAVCREAAAECNDKSSKRIASAVTRAAIENLARADRRHAATVDDWDQQAWLLTTPGSTIDLRTGDSKPNAPADLITKTTAVAPKVGCDRWLEFLRRVTDGDDDLCSFLQRVAGYALTGLTREHALFFLYGLGANGKSVFINTLSGVFGDYLFNNTQAGIQNFGVTFSLWRIIVKQHDALTQHHGSGGPGNNRFLRQHISQSEQANAIDQYGYVTASDQYQAGIRHLELHGLAQCGRTGDKQCRSACIEILVECRDPPDMMSIQCAHLGNCSALFQSQKIGFSLLAQKLACCFHGRRKADPVQPLQFQQFVLSRSLQGK